MSNVLKDGFKVNRKVKDAKPWAGQNKFLEALRRVQNTAKFTPYKTVPRCGACSTDLGQAGAFRTKLRSGLELSWPISLEHDILFHGHNPSVEFKRAIINAETESRGAKVQAEAKPAKKPAPAKATVRQEKKAAAEGEQVELPNWAGGGIDLRHVSPEAHTVLLARALSDIIDVCKPNKDDVARILSRQGISHAALVDMTKSSSQTVRIEVQAISK